MPATSPVRAAVAVGLGVVLTAVVAGALFAWLRGDDDTATPSPPVTPGVPRPESTPTTAPTTPPPADPSVEATHPPAGDEAGATTTFPAVPGLAVAESGFSTYPGAGGGRVGSYGVVLENTGDTPLGFLGVEVTVRDTRGEIVAANVHAVTTVPPGGSFGLGAEVAGPLPAGIGQIDVHIEPDDGAPPDGGVTAAEVSTTSDGFGTYTSFVVSSTYGEELAEPHAYVVYRNAAGVVVGGDGARLDPLPAGGRARSEVASYERIPRVARAEVHVDPGLFRA